LPLAPLFLTLEHDRYKLCGKKAYFTSIVSYSTALALMCCGATARTAASPASKTSMNAVDRERLIELDNVFLLAS
jgi:hypothetical protein